MLNLSPKNVVRSKKTTIAGSALSLSAVISVFMGVSTWTESSMIIGVGLYLMFEEDPKKDEKNTDNTD